MLASAEKFVERPAAPARATPSEAGHGGENGVAQEKVNDGLLGVKTEV
jgi:hypothetical protein